MIRNATSADADEIARIYNHYVNDTIVTFEEVPVSAEEMRGRMSKVLGSGLPWLVWEEQDCLGVALPNAASVALHEKMGMRKVAHFKETGFKFGRWIDVAYWQLTL